MSLRKATEQEVNDFIADWKLDACFDLYDPSWSDEDYIFHYSDYSVDYSDHKETFKLAQEKFYREADERMEKEVIEKTNALGIPVSAYRAYYRPNESKAKHCQQEAEKMFLHYMTLLFGNQGNSVDSDMRTEWKLILDEIKRAAVYQAKQEIYHELFADGLIQFKNPEDNV